MASLLNQITRKKQTLDQLRPLAQDLVKNLDDWYRVELTYTSNAIEGNTLSRQETALIVEKGLTVSGKTLVEHQEAVNHAQAFDFVNTLAKNSRAKFDEADVLDIHRLILQKIDDVDAGRYRTMAVRIAGSNVVLPNAAKVPQLMQEFIAWLNTNRVSHPVTLATDAHYKLVSIHPFIDGNGRTGRLLMNLLLLQAGYPPAVIRKADRLRYITALETGQLGGPLDAYYQLIYQTVEKSLDLYLKTVRSKSTPQTKTKSKLLKIGKLAQTTRESIHTLRFWAKQGLIEVADLTESGYQLFDPAAIEKVKQIRRLQKEQRLTLAEIKEKLKEASS